VGLDEGEEVRVGEFIISFIPQFDLLKTFGGMASNCSFLKFCGKIVRKSFLFSQADPYARLASLLVGHLVEPFPFSQSHDFRMR